VWTRLAHGLLGTTGASILVVLAGLALDVGAQHRWQLFVDGVLVM
jgi:hypothetical protein